MFKIIQYYSTMSEWDIIVPTFQYEDMMDKFSQTIRESIDPSTNIIQIFKHGDFESKAIETWVGYIQDFGERLLLNAEGISAMKGYKTPKLEDMVASHRIFYQGIDQIILSFAQKTT